MGATESQFGPYLDNMSNFSLSGNSATSAGYSNSQPPAVLTGQLEPPTSGGTFAINDSNSLLSGRDSHVGIVLPTSDVTIGKEENVSCGANLINK